MKRIILLSTCIIGLCSCKKDKQAPLKITATSWISGKWKRTMYVDTIYNGKIVAGINHFQVDLNPSELTFVDDNSGTGTVATQTTFNYSLSPALLTYTGGNTWNITKISETQFKLTMRSDQYGIGYLDQYVKE